MHVDQSHETDLGTGRSSCLAHVCSTLQSRWIADCGSEPGQILREPMRRCAFWRRLCSGEEIRIPPSTPTGSADLGNKPVLCISTSRSKVCHLVLQEHSSPFCHSRQRACNAVRLAHSGSGREDILNLTCLVAVLGFMVKACEASLHITIASSC